MVAPEGEATKVDVDTDFTITGRLARFGRGGMIEDVSRRLLGDFSSCLQQRIVAEAPPPAPTAAPGPEDAAAAVPAPPTPPPPAAKPVNGLRLFFQVLGDRIKRLLRRSG